MDEDTENNRVEEIGTHILLFFLVFGMSATVDIGHMRKQLRNWRALMIGLSLQFIFLPFVGFCIVKILKMDETIGVTLLVVTTSPGGSYSNWWCSLFNADLALSVTMTGISTLLSTVMLPLNLVIYTWSTYSNEVVKSLDWFALFLSLIVVLGGITSGVLTSAWYNSTRFNLMANKLGNLAGLAMVVFSAAMSLTNKDGGGVWNQDATFYIGCALPAIVGFFARPSRTPRHLQRSEIAMWHLPRLGPSSAQRVRLLFVFALAILVPSSHGVSSRSFLDPYGNEAADVAAPVHAEPGPAHTQHADSSKSKEGEQRESESVLAAADVKADCAGAVATGLISTVVLVPVVFFMAVYPSTSALTLRMLDTTISIFLAVVWFTAFSDLIALDVIHDAHEHAEEAVALLQVLALYVIVLALAHRWRFQRLQLVCFCGCGAHYIAFAGIRLTGETQHEFSQSMADDESTLASFLFCLLCLGCLVLISACRRWVWRRKDLEEEALDEAVNELELDILGLVMSFVITQAVRQLITGRYPAEAHETLKETMDKAGQHHAALMGMDASVLVHGAPHGHPHTELQRGLILAWTLSLTLLCSFILVPLERYSLRAGHYGKNAVHMIKVVLIMCTAWGYLLWGEWQFFENYFSGDPMLGRVLFALIMTLACLGLICILATLDHRYIAVKNTSRVSISGASLVTAWSWEHCFQLALTTVGQKYAVGLGVGLGPLLPKIILALVMPAVTLPVYLTYIKPQIILLEAKELEQDEQQH